MLSDWNGWNEGTAIEDSESWKDTYGNTTLAWYRLLTQGYAAAYKGELIDGFYYRSDSSDAVYLWKDREFAYQGAYPHKRPVVVLPPGYLEKLSKKTVPDPPLPSP